MKIKQYIIKCIQRPSNLKARFFFWNTTKTLCLQVPYQSQFASSLLVKDILTWEDDPLWNTWDIESLEEYKKRSMNVCGMACLSMILKHIWTDLVLDPIALWKQAINYDVYKADIHSSNGLSPMYYKEFVRYVRKEYGLICSILQEVTGLLLYSLISEWKYCIASVSPKIRNYNESYSGSTWGHLVLIVWMTIQKWSIESIKIHNPSGWSENNSQKYHSIPRKIFIKYWNRRILVLESK